MINQRTNFCAAFFLIGMSFVSPLITAGEPLSGTAPFVDVGDLDSVVDKQYEQVVNYFRTQIEEAKTKRDQKWTPDFSCEQAYRRSVAVHQASCAKMLGLYRVDEKTLRLHSDVISKTESYLVERITVKTNAVPISARGLLLRPNTKGPHSLIVICPDATDWPEKLIHLDQKGKLPAWLNHLIECGAMVYIPQSIERLVDHPYCQLTKGKNRREILHRLGFVIGRSMSGLDVQDTLIAINQLVDHHNVDHSKIGIVGIGQGGMTALFVSAMNQRIRATAVTDYFQSHALCNEEPVDRRLFGRLLKFGDAELAAMIAPNSLAVLRTSKSSISRKDITGEISRANRFHKGLNQQDQLRFIDNVSPSEAISASVFQVAGQLGLVKRESQNNLPVIAFSEKKIRSVRDLHFQERLDYVRVLIEQSEAIRNKRWGMTKHPPEDFPAIKKEMLADFLQLVGKVETEGTPLLPRTELVVETDKYKGYRVLLNVCPGVEVYGNLLVPKHIKGKTAAVITQHGFGGTPEMLTAIGGEQKTAYHNFGRSIAEQGFVVFAPLLQHRTPSKRVSDQMILAEATGMARVAMPVAKTERIIDFLQTLPFVDSEQIGYYGLSYGGFSALWIGPLAQRLKIVIPSGHFNDWRSKITADNINTSYLRHPDEDMYNWNILNRFTHVEMIAMMAPRPVCIEFGQRDGITTPQWTAYAWKQVVDIRDWLNLQDSIELAHYDGVHEIHGVQTFDFLNRFLRPQRPVGRDGNDLVKTILESNEKSHIKGRFWIPAGAEQFRGIEIKLAPIGNPGPLSVRFGSEYGKADHGELNIKSIDSKTDSATWYALPVPSQNVRPGQLIYFELSTSQSDPKENHYLIYGPRPLGGKHWGHNFGLSYRVLVE